jgi:hypothetical protein
MSEDQQDDIDPAPADLIIPEGQDRAILDRLRGCIDPHEQRQAITYVAVVQREGEMAEVCATNGRVLAVAKAASIGCCGSLKPGSYRDVRLIDGTRALILDPHAPKFPNYGKMFANQKKDWVVEDEVGYDGSVERAELLYRIAEKGPRLNPSLLRRPFPNSKTMMVQAAGGGPLDSVQFVFGALGGLTMLVMPFRTGKTTKYRGYDDEGQDVDTHERSDLAPPPGAPDA